MALQGQLVETRREVAEFHRRAILAESRTTTAALADAAFPPAAGTSSQPQPGLAVGPHVGVLPPAAPTPPAMTYAAALQVGASSAAPSTGPPGLTSGPGPVLHEHVAFVTPIAPTSTPARDSLRLLKDNIDPAAHDIRDVTLRQTSYGLTVFAHSRATLTNMRQAIADNTITCAALSMRIPEKRNPHVRFSGVDPDVFADEFVARVADCNPHLQLDPGKCKVRASFRERSGTLAMIVEVDPDAFTRIMRQQRISVGWTSVRVAEDLHVATCTFCATYGHGQGGDSAPRSHALGKSSPPGEGSVPQAQCRGTGGAALAGGRIGEVDRSTGARTATGTAGRCTSEVDRSTGTRTGYTAPGEAHTTTGRSGIDEKDVSEAVGGDAVDGAEDVVPEVGEARTVDTIDEADGAGAEDSVAGITNLGRHLDGFLDAAKRRGRHIDRHERTVQAGGHVDHRAETKKKDRHVGAPASKMSFQSAQGIGGSPGVERKSGGGMGDAITREKLYTKRRKEENENERETPTRKESPQCSRIDAEPLDGEKAEETRRDGRYGEQRSDGGKRRKDPQAIIVTRNPPFDVCPVHVSTNVVGPVALAGDFNAKHQLWGPMETVERGLQLAQFVLSSDLVPLNDATSLPTFETPYSASWIDVTFATPQVTSAGFEWLVAEDTTFSEHRLVEVRVGESPTQEKRLTSYARLQLLEALRRETWFTRVSGASLASSDALDLVLSGLYALYTWLYTRHLRPVRARPTSKPWFTPALAIERAAVAAKRRRFQRARDPQMRVVFRRQYTSALAAFRQNIREAREVHVRGYTLSCVRGSFFSEPLKEAFGRLRQFRCLPSLIAPDGTLTSTHLESASLLLHTQIAVDDPTTDEAMHASTRALAAEPYISRYQDVTFTYSEVVDVLRNTPNKSAPGPDHISPVIMKALFKFHPRFFLMVFNAALHLGYFPRCWRTARVSFIHKPGRPPERTSSYRPICVSSVYGKTLERLLNGRLQHFLLKHDLVNPRQFGFTKGRSSLLALHELNTHLLNLKAQRMPAVLMSLDFHGAFDSVWHPLVLRYFREHVLPSDLYHLLRTFLADRPTLGSPQGSPLSPLLWNIVIDSLLSLRMPRGVVIQAYADTIILIPAPSRDALGNLASRVLRRVVNWSRAVKVSLNCDKTFCVLFTHGVGGMARVRPTIRLSPTDPTLQFRDTLRVLGVVFDLIDACRFSTTPTTFARSPVNKVLMYRQVILPALTYACPVWWGEDHVDCRFYARVVTVQRVALLALTRAYRTTSTAALQVLLHAPPIDLEIARVNTEFRLFTLRIHVAFGSLRFRPTWVADAHAHVPLHPSVPVAVPFVRLTSAQARAAASSTAVHIYTDGSFTNASAGAAFVAFGPDGRVFSVGRFRLTRATSAYAAEVVAFKEAINHALAAHYTFPLAVPLHVCHVPGHAGIFGNEVADFLATRASSSGQAAATPGVTRFVDGTLARNQHAHRTL
ncbi:hypothetical protein HPB52_023783 [Rhipicephalus sanguineus]|uniref:Reverse transcriptase domain-containing protein n=1 Tax=Rhipicephalus sanguineus TaxID=34632 RepID=A0A9D4Q4I2_RHISA|nr:hypothetical protein HPB52_023783 [Rhipicephalus sanguineus]